MEAITLGNHGDEIHKAQHAGMHDTSTKGKVHTPKAYVNNEHMEEGRKKNEQCTSTLRIFIQSESHNDKVNNAQTHGEKVRKAHTQRNKDHKTQATATKLQKARTWTMYTCQIYMGTMNTRKIHWRKVQKTHWHGDKQGTAEVHRNKGYGVKSGANTQMINSGVLLGAFKYPQLKFPVPTYY
ncbi:hypothetical protein MAR_004212 [Mya arenaria]|uniref:Uncharacterized protein n=1 Tax=Mya arenaria TaxID=6604 RepID=A0ABY7EVW7_MYAAR|nr:hypothetical protein MAR_004212 [Mya arenaria]